MKPLLVENLPCDMKAFGPTHPSPFSANVMYGQPLVYSTYYSCDWTKSFLSRIPNLNHHLTDPANNKYKYFPDDRSPVGALEVPPHDLVEPPVGEDEALELEAARPQQVHRLLVLVREPEGVVVPPAKDNYDPPM